LDYLLLVRLLWISFKLPGMMLVLSCLYRLFRAISLASRVPVLGIPSYQGQNRVQRIRPITITDSLNSSLRMVVGRCPVISCIVETRVEIGSSKATPHFAAWLWPIIFYYYLGKFSLPNKWVELMDRSSRIISATQTVEATAGGT
jgi:hypothetical protein